MDMDGRLLEMLRENRKLDLANQEDARNIQILQARIQQRQGQQQRLNIELEVLEGLPKEVEDAG